VNRFKQGYLSMQEHARRYHKAYHHAHNGLHLSYLGLVASHGPYSWAAAALFFLIVIGYALSLEASK